MRVPPPLKSEVRFSVMTILPSTPALVGNAPHPETVKDGAVMLTLASKLNGMKPNRNSAAFNTRIK